MVSSSRPTIVRKAKPLKFVTTKAGARGKRKLVFVSKPPPARRAPPKKIPKITKSPNQIKLEKAIVKATVLQKKVGLERAKQVASKKSAIFRKTVGKKAKPIKTKLSTSDFKAGDRVSIKTRKGGTKTFRLESEDGSKTLRFAISQKDFTNKGDPRKVKTKISKTRKPKSSFGRKVGRNQTPRTPRRIGRPEGDFGADFNVFRVDQFAENNQRINQAGSDLGQKLRQQVDPTLQRAGEVALNLPFFVPRELAKPNSPLRQAIAFTPIGQAGTFLSERVSNKPLAKKDRLIGSDFDVLNFFG